MAPDPVDAFFASYDDDVAALARGLRALVVRLAPDADEKLHSGWKTVAYGSGSGSGAGRRAKFCAISPHRAWVNLQLHRGAGLPDPSGLLQGTGKSMRHVKIEAPKQLKGRALASLIRAAASEAE